MRDRLGRWLAGRSPTVIAFWQAVAVAVLAWFGATLSVWLSNKTKVAYIIISVVGIIAVAVVGFASRYLSALRYRYTSSRAEAIEFVHSQLDRLASEDQRAIERVSEPRRMCLPSAPMLSIDYLVRSVFDFLNSKYQNEAVPGEKIYFEAVCMSKSYLDGQITICSWANSADSMPTSLIMRQTQPNIYDRTVTADIYREASMKRPEPRLISDTESDPNYVQLYPKQHQSIRSTIAYPIMCSSARLMGALVVTANRSNLFRQADRDFWFSVLNLYERRIARELVRLDVGVREFQVAAPY